MKIKEKGQNYEISEDGSVKISCVKCQKENFLKSDSPYAIRFHQIEEADKGSNYECLSCWKKNKEGEKQMREEERQDKISNGQALNLAVETTLSYVPPNAENFKAKIVEWVKFYKNLIQELNED